MIEALKERFGQDKVSVYKKISDRLTVLKIDLLSSKNSTILLTHGLSNYEMPVHQKQVGKEYNELYFCIPKYWDLNETDNPNRQWPVEWLEKLTHHVIEKKSWYGSGHTILCYKDYRSLSETMKQNHLLMVDPIYLKTEMQPIQILEKTVHFLGLIPLFGDEMDYKQGKGTQKLLSKLHHKGHNEKLDDYRESVLRSRIRFWA